MVIIIWFLNKTSLIGLDNDIFRQIYLKGHEIRSLKIPDILPELLKEVNTAKRNFHHKIKTHQKFLKINKWFTRVKSLNTPATCSGCLKKGVIKYGNLHLHTKGGFHLVYKDPSLIFLREQRAEVQVEGFIIHGSYPIDCS